MATWSDFQSEFPTAHQPVITDLETTYVVNFGVTSYEAFALKSASDIRNDLSALDDTNVFVLELGTFLKGMQSGATDYSTYVSGFDIEDQGFAGDLADYYENTVEFSWEDFTNETSTDIATSASQFDGTQDFWLNYGLALNARRDTLSLDQFIASLPSADQAGMQALVDSLTGDSTIDNVYDLADLDRRALAAKIDAFASTHAFIVRAATLFKEQASDLVTGNYTDDEIDTLFYEDLLEEYHRIPLMRKGGEALIESLITATTISTIRDLATLSLTTLQTHIANQGTAHWYLHALAEYVRYEASAYEVGLIDPDTQQDIKLTVRLGETGDSSPIGMKRIAIYDYDIVADPILIDSRVTDNFGMLTFTFTDDPTVTGYTKDLRFSVFNLEDDVTVDTPLATSSTVSYDPENGNTLDVSVTMPADSTSYITIDYLINTVGVTIASELQTFLTSESITDLEDVRAKGGVSHFSDPAVAANPSQAQRIDAHAQFELISSDAVFNDYLVDLGYNSLSDIAAASRESFVDDVVNTTGSTYGEVTGAEAWLKARNGDAFLATTLAGLGAAYGSNYKQAVGSMGTEPSGIVDGLFSDRCNCPDCQSGVSPLAYLASLLDYSTRYIQNSGANIDLDWLQTNFYQNFCELPADCDSVNDEVCQVRVAIEVLVAQSITPDSDMYDEYLRESYKLLLNQYGATPELVELVASNPANLYEDEKLNLAARMGIDDGRIDDLWLYEASGGTPTLTEENLELVFGLQSTARNVFSSGYKLDDSNNDISAWRFNGVRYGRNTNEDGFIYIDLITTSTPDEVKVYKSDSFSTDTLIGYGTITTSTPYVVKIYPRNDSGLSGMLELDSAGYVATSAISFSVVPQIVAWRLDYLRAQWYAQDQPTTNPYTWGTGRVVPYIDPDMIGPDDFRVTLTSSAPFALWVHRRDWVDTEVVAALEAETGDLDAMIDFMESSSPQLDYDYEDASGTVSKTVWDTTQIPSAYSTAHSSGHWEMWQEIHEDIMDGTNETDVSDVLEDFFFLEKQAFMRAYELFDIHQDQTGTLTAEEEAEFIDILTQSAKNVFYATWVTEENNRTVTLNPSDFYTSITEPKEGTWDREPDGSTYGVSAANTPFIDPDFFSIPDLADYPYGDNPQTLRSARETELKDKWDDIFDSRLNTTSGLTKKYEEMFLEAIGGIPTFPTGYSSLDDIYDEIQSASPATAAVTYVNEDLYWTLDEFRSAMTVISAEDASSSSVSDDDYKELARLMTFAHKRKTLWPTWATEEASTGYLLDNYYEVYKQRIPKWRGKDGRSTWKAALAHLGRTPLVEPDLLAPGDFVDPEYRGNANLDNPAYVLFRSRQTTVSGWLTTIQGNSIDTNIADEIGVTATELANLQTLSDNGGDISKPLERLNMTADEMAYVIKMKNKVDNSQALTAEEEAATDNIFLQVKKRRNYESWNTGELAGEIYLTTDYFLKAYENAADMNEYREDIRIEWRSDRMERKAFDDKLAARILQEESILKGAEGAVRATEDETLLILRNALILGSSAAGSNLEEKGETLTDKHLIDMRINCCQSTTRVSEAIKTLQSLFHGLRTGQLSSDYPNLALIGDDFDRDWKWLGSYEAWRGLMFAYLYPENLLLPSLRPNQSGVFTGIVDRLRNNPRVSPELACQAMAEYEDYMLDVHSLELQAACITTVDFAPQNCTGHLRSARPVHFQFAKGGKTETLYWSSFDESRTSSYAQTLWEAVPGMDDIHKAIGATVYKVRSGERFLYVFALKKKPGSQPALVANRFNLKTLRWQNDLDEFTAEVNSWTWVLGHRKDESEAPVLAASTYTWKALWGEADHLVDVSEELNQGANPYSSDPSAVFEGELHNRIVYYNRLDSEGVTWKDDEFTRLEMDWMHSLKLLSVISFDDDCLGFMMHGKYTADDNRLIYHIEYPNRTTGIHKPVRIMPENSSSYFPTAPSQLTGNWGNLFERYYSEAHEFRTLKSGFDFAEFVGTAHVSDNGGTDVYAFSYKDSNGDTKQFAYYLQTGVVYYPKEVLNTPSGPNPKTITGCKLTTVGITGSDPFQMVYYAPCFKHESGQTSAVPNTFAYQTSNGQKPLFLYTLPLQVIAISPVSREVYPLGDTDNPPVDRSVTIESLYTDNETLSNASLSYKNPNLIYIEEAYYALPLLLAMELQKAKFYDEALDYYRLVYDYRQAVSNRKVWYGLRREETISNLFSSAFDWLDDPNNPHNIANVRKNAHTRFVIFNIIQCFLDYADQEFTRDTSESVPRARLLYDTALELLQEEIFDASTETCQSILTGADALVDDAGWLPEWHRLRNRILAINSVSITSDLFDGWSGGYAGIDSEFQSTGLDWETRFENLEDAIETKLDAIGSAAVRICDAVNSYSWNTVNDSMMAALGMSGTTTGMQRMASRTSDTFHRALEGITGQEKDYYKSSTTLTWLSDSRTATLTSSLSNPTATQVELGGEGYRQQYRTTYDIETLYESTVLDRPWVPIQGYYFCVPENPLPFALLLHAELNLHKIRNCRNIAGLRREMPAYAAPTDTVSGLPMIGASGNLVLSGTGSAKATEYRWEAVLAKAKELVNYAQQAEQAMLSSLEKRDGEYYGLLRARQDVKVARATLKLQDLRVSEAAHGIDLAELQRERSLIQTSALAGWVNGGLSGLEKANIAQILTAFSLRALTASAATLEKIASYQAALKNPLNAASAPDYAAASVFAAAAGAFGIAADSAQTQAQINGILASYERRMQEWKLQLSLAQQDYRIGTKSIQLAQDRMRIVGQERHISKLNMDFAEDALNFLMNKFTNAELYDWMSRVLEGVYAYFLGQATSMAKVAQAQLAFERQEPEATFIQDDYWYPASENVSFSAQEGERVDRKGLTGSLRLLQDIEKLDLYAFETTRRKHQLTKTISLARLAPAEFELFRQTGVLSFRTPMELFDKDFPGHYLRLIKQVRTSVIALIPPTEGIKASLSTTGISKVVTENQGVFRGVDVPRAPESVALTSPYNSTGLFELQSQRADLLNPFEGMGVDAQWEFKMIPAANPFDFGTVADILITVDYTALESTDRFEEVADLLESEGMEGEQIFSLKYQFPDQWYDLHHPEQIANDYEVEIELKTTDFPANVSDSSIKHVTLVVVTEDREDAQDIQVVLQKYDPISGGFVGNAAVPNLNRIISTRSGSAGGSTSGYAIYSGNGASAWAAMQGMKTEGTYKIALLDQINGAAGAVADLFDEEQVMDIILIVTYEADAPVYRV